jgi:hypothetical protein
MLNPQDVREGLILTVYLGQQKRARSKGKLGQLVALADRVLALREHEWEIPIDAYLAELERLRMEVKSL